jgi:DNA-binding NarL/FixJ family response regulator
MSMTSPDRIELNLAQQQRLRYLIRAGTTAQQLVQRARIVVLAAAGWTNTRIAEHLRGVRGHRSQVAPPLAGAAGYGLAR